VELIEEYKRRLGDYDAFTKCVESLLKTLLREASIRPHSINGRVKDSQSLEAKIKRPSKNYASLNQITDICGIRIITYFSEEVDLVAKLPVASRQGLRAVFLLAGTRKQEKSWFSNLGCYGTYWNSCVFLYAHPFNLPSGYTLDHLRRFYLDDVLVHEVAHHIDRERIADHKTKESFAHAFVQQQLRA
jgi:hypothetical protein